MASVLISGRFVIIVCILSSPCCEVPVQALNKAMLNNKISFRYICSDSASDQFINQKLQINLVLSGRTRNF